MLNFDTTFVKGKKTIEVKNNIIVNLSFSEISSSLGNAFIRYYTENFIKPALTAKIETDFDLLIQDVKYISSALHLMLQIKEINCSYSNKSLEELKDWADYFKTSYLNKIDQALYSSEPQSLILRYLLTGDNTYSTYEIASKYNPISDDASQLEKWYAELTNFNYKKYGINKEEILNLHNTDSFVKGASQIYEAVQTKISNFKALIQEAGDDIINWSDTKITLRLKKKLGLQCRAWELNTYLRSYKEYLSEIGVEKKIQVDKNKLKKEKLKDKVLSRKATQEEYFKYFKQVSDYDASNIIPYIEKEYLFKIIESPLKCVTSKLKSNWGNTLTYKAILTKLMMVSETREDAVRLTKWVGGENLNLNFMENNFRYLSDEDIIEFCEYNDFPETHAIKEEFFQKILEIIPKENIFCIKSSLTYQALLRLNTSEKIDFLKNITKYQVASSVNYLYACFEDVPYQEIREYLLKNDLVLVNLIELAIKNKDHEVMLKAALSVSSYIKAPIRYRLFYSLPYEKQREVIREDTEGLFKDNIVHLSSKKRLEVLREIINFENHQRITRAVIDSFKDREDIMEVNKIVKSIQDPNNLPLDINVIEKLDISTKVTLLNRGIELLDAPTPYYSSTSGRVTSDILGKAYFSDFKREDVEKVCKSITAYKFNKFIAHTMTREELEYCADSEIRLWDKHTNIFNLENSFLRYNLALFSYGYLKQFKNKSKFRVVVGDRRKSSNNSFGDILLQKLKVTNSLDFMFSD